MISWSKLAPLAGGIALALTPGGACSGQNNPAPGTAQSPLTTMQLAIPRGDPGKALVLLVTVGALPRGARVDIYGPHNELLGTASPFGLQAARAGGTYRIPLPSEFTAADAVTVSSQLTDAAGLKRKPTPDELRRITVLREVYPASPSR